MAELKNYVLAEMLWNPAQDPAVLIDEFLRGFFGADGAQYVRAHMDNVHRSMQAAGCNSTANSYSDGCLNSCCDYPPGESIRWAVAASRCLTQSAYVDIAAGPRDKPYLNPRSLILSAQALRRGLAATNGTIFQSRVNKVYFSVLYSILWNWDAVVHEAIALSIPW